MVSTSRFVAIALSFFVFAVFMDLSAAEYLSDHIFEPRPAIGRGLLQADKPCPVDFEYKNYTIITSQCKGPLYLPSRCCSAFKQFACPYRDVLNDLGNNCAKVMFAYIHLYGKYPAGLFANECRDDKIGLLCNLTSTENHQVSPNAAHIAYVSSLCLVLVAIAASLVL
ncbi:GPI-anchored protein LLG1-like [Nymphaea colorata]|nr:GPI-anchored protein LLG1-like [Nymphaea colorata]